MGSILTERSVAEIQPELGRVRNITRPANERSIRSEDHQVACVDVQAFRLVSPFSHLASCRQPAARFYGTIEAVHQPSANEAHQVLALPAVRLGFIAQLLPVLQAIELLADPQH